MIEDDDDTLTAADADLILLESHLDDALDPAEAAALRTRLAADPALSAQLAGLRVERSARAAAYASLEPDAVTVERLHWQVRGAVAASAVRRPAAVGRFWTARADPWRLARIGTAAAACLVLGVLGGRLGRGPNPTAQPSVAQTNLAQTNVVPQPTGAPIIVTAAGGTDVPIFDEYGREIARQHFDSPEQARRFEDDLHRTEGPGVAGVGGPAHLASEIRY